MALMITDRCINCGYCEPECPNQAIYEPGAYWSMAEGTTLNRKVSLYNGTEVDAKESLEPISYEYFFIVPEKCTGCAGVFEKPVCRTVCPNPEAIVTHPRYGEYFNELLDKQMWLNL